MNSTHTTPSATPFGVVQIFLAGTLLLLGGLLAIPFYLTGAGQAAPASAAGSGLLAVSLTLWLLETALYCIISTVLSRRNWLVGFIGTALGLLLRLGLTLLMAWLIGARSHADTAVVFLQINGDHWPLRLLAIAFSAATLVLPLRGLLASGFRIRNTGRQYRDTARHFSFKSAVDAPTGPSRATATTGAHEQRHEAQTVTPPEGFMPIPAQDDITGTIDIPVEVICASVPEARAFLRRELPVSVRLACIVPQLANATVWLTWQQIFSSGSDDPNREHGPERPDVSLQGRWVRLPARTYVTQVPRRYFSRPAPAAALKWMKRTPVPQEAQFSEDEPEPTRLAG